MNCYDRARVRQVELISLILLNPRKRSHIDVSFPKVSPLNEALVDLKAKERAALAAAAATVPRRKKPTLVLEVGATSPDLFVCLFVVMLHIVKNDTV